MQQETVAMIQGGVIAGVINLIFNGAWYYGFQRRTEKSDKTLESMSERIRLLEEEKIKGIQERLASGAEEFDELHESQEKMMKRPDFILHQEQCDRKFVSISADIKSIQRDITSITAQNAASQAVLQLIAAKLNISLGDRHVKTH